MNSQAALNRPTLGPMIRLFLWLNGLVFLFLQILGRTPYTFLSGDGVVAEVPFRTLLISIFGLVPNSVLSYRALWQPLTYMFVHQEAWHLLFNMLALYWFGTEIELLWGSRKFFRYYLFTGIGAALTAIALALTPWGSLHSATIGASGAIFGLLLAFGLLFPDRVIYLYFVVPLKAKYCVLIFGLLEFWMLVFASGDGVSHVAHLGGILFGLIWFATQGRGMHLASIWRGIARRRMRRKLRLVRKPKDDGPEGGYTNKTLH